MQAKSRTIEIVLHNGDPSGIRISQITTEVAQIIEVPRDHWREFLELKQSTQPAIYFLVSMPEDDSESDLYIGQSGDLKSRFRTHLEKDFWDRAIILLDSNNRISETETKFLEWHCLQLAQKSANFRIVNGNSGSKPHTARSVEDRCINIFESGRVLLDTLGYRLFNSVESSINRADSDELFYNNYSEAKGVGKRVDDGFLVLKESSGRKDLVPSSKNSSLERLRAKLLGSGVLRVEGDRIVFTQDYLFRSPSTAACVLLGRNTNGWLTWKNRENKTLDDLGRDE